MALYESNVVGHGFARHGQRVDARAGSGARAAPRLKQLKHTRAISIFLFILKALVDSK